MFKHFFHSCVSQVKRHVEAAADETEVGGLVTRCCASKLDRQRKNDSNVCLSFKSCPLPFPPSTLT